MKKTLVLCLFLLSTYLLAQQPVTLIFKGGNVYNNFYASYLDVNNAANQPIIFTTMIQNTTNNTIEKYKLNVKLFWNSSLLFDENFKSKNSFKPRQIINLTSADLLNEDGNTYFYGTDLDLDKIKQNNNNFSDILEDNGYFPDGTYTISAVCVDENNNAISNQLTNINIMTIVNPLALNLIYPGNNLGESIFLLNNKFPNFVWISNLDNFTLTIYELDEDALIDESTIESQEVFYSLTKNQNITSLTYPQNAPAFEQNKIYAWQIKAKLNIPSLHQQDEYKYSSYKLFKLKPAQNKNTANLQVNPLTSILVEFFNQNPVNGSDEVINLLNSGYKSSGDFYYNNSKINQGKLYDIIQKINSKKLKIKSISVN